MSNSLITRVYDLTLPSTAKAVLLALANRADGSGYCFPSQALLARETGFSERTVRGHLGWLKREGYVRRSVRVAKWGRFVSHGYHVLPDTGGVPDAPLPAEEKGQDQRQDETSPAATKDHNQRQDVPTNPKRTIKEPTPEPQGDVCEGFEEMIEAFHQAYPERDGGQGWQEADVLLVGLLRDGVDPDKLLEAAKSYGSAKAHLLGADRRFIKAAVNFLKEGLWKDYQAKPSLPMIAPEDERWPMFIRFVVEQSGNPQAEELYKEGGLLHKSVPMPEGFAEYLEEA